MKILSVVKETPDIIRGKYKKLLESVPPAGWLPIQFESGKEKRNAMQAIYKAKREGVISDFRSISGILYVTREKKK